jgi:F-type H+-transporting ATPase subunit a
MAESPVDPVQTAVHHLSDSASFDLPFGCKIEIPQPFERVGIRFHVTKMMCIELIAALLMIAIFVPLARKVAGGKPPKGRLWNLFEAIVLFIRNEIARPAIGHHDADRFMPFVLTMFFFILFCNLLGIVPWLGSPTGSISVTGALALTAFCVAIGSCIRKFGLWKFLGSIAPKMDLPWVLWIPMVAMIWVIEVFGLLIKHTILAVRLLANIFAGHLVLGVIVAFLAVLASSTMWYGVAPVAILGAASLNLLELLVAVLQAYVFAFLAALFLGMLLHPH